MALCSPCAEWKIQNKTDFSSFFLFWKELVGSEGCVPLLPCVSHSSLKDTHGINIQANMNRLNSRMELSQSSGTFA